MTLSCSDLKEHISSFVDGELEKEQYQTIETHLTLCPDCVSACNSFKRFGEGLKFANNKACSEAPDLWAAIAGKLPSICECIQEDLSAYLDGELIAPAKEGVAAHLDQCKECLHSFNQLSQVNNLLAKGLNLPHSTEVDIWNHVQSRLNDDCALIRTEISAFIDREVPTLRHRTITAHLMECEPCKREFNHLSQTGESIRSHYRPDIQDDLDLWPGIRSRMNIVTMESREKSVRRMPSMRRLSAVAAVVVSGVAASTMLTMYMQTQNTPAVQPVSAEAYLIDQSLGEPTDIADAVAYDHQP